MKAFVLLLLLATAASAEEPRRYIVEFNDAHVRSSEPRAVARLREAVPRARVRQEFRLALDGAVIDLEEGASLDAIRKLPYVERVTPDVEVTAHAIEGARVASEVRRVDTNASGQGVTVAVIDSGIDYRHPALGGGFGPGFKVAGGWDFVNGDGDPMDDNRHGTHVAGIIAASSLEMSGVATGVRLLAFKVLDARGRGRSSDIIAAIERSMDPNQDGDLSDRADVINLSLGSGGDPDDPSSRAVERAVAAGVVVCVSAGNTGVFHTIGSPAAAASAISVGATDGQNLADFSAGGPVKRSGAIKPDLLAPGVSIRSTLPDGNYGPLSGTSMACPYVAGLAALLIEQQPEWTPARIKAALVATAMPLPATEVMVQGTGSVNVARAFGSDIDLHPTQLNFGNDGIAGPVWQSTRTITFRNDSAASRSFTVRADAAPNGIALTLPAPFTLAPGESRELQFGITVDNGIVTKPLTPSMSFGGIVSVEWNGGEVRLPWAFVRAARVMVGYENSFSSVAWTIPPGVLQSQYPGAEAHELLVERGEYGMIVAAEDNGALRLVGRERQLVEGDLVLSFSGADTPHELRLDSFPDRFPSDDTLYTTNGRVITDSMTLALPMRGRSVFTSPLSEAYTLLFSESVVDVEAREIHIAQYEPLRGVSAGRVMRREPGEFAAQPLVLHPPKGESGGVVRVMPRDWPRSIDFYTPQPPSVEMPFSGDRWTATLFMTPEVHQEVAAGVQLQMRRKDEEVVASYFTPVIRRNEAGFFSTRVFDPIESEVATAGETMAFGDGALHAPIYFLVTPAGIHGPPELRGDRSESRRDEAGTLRYDVIDRETQQKLASGAVLPGMVSIPLPRAAAIAATFSSDECVVAGRRASVELSLSADTRRGESELPVITSLSVLDGNGRHRTSLARGGNGALVFSVDRATSVRVFLRRVDRATWVEATAVAIDDDEALGTVHRVDLADMLQVDGEVAIRIEAVGENESAIDWQLAPAFVVEPEAKRRRAVR